MERGVTSSFIFLFFLLIINLKLKIMEIIALAYKTKAKSDFDNSVLYAFFQPAWGGNHIVEAELLIREDDLLDYKEPLVSDSYAEAHMKAHKVVYDLYGYARDYPEYFKEASEKQQLKED